MEGVAIVERVVGAMKGLAPALSLPTNAGRATALNLFANAGRANVKTEKHHSPAPILPRGKSAPMVTAVEVEAKVEYGAEAVAGLCTREGGTSSDADSHGVSPVVEVTSEVTTEVASEEAEVATTIAEKILPSVSAPKLHSPSFADRAEEEVAQLHRVRASLITTSEQSVVLST